MYEKIGKYELIEKIASTRRGVVYKAQDPNIGRTVAIKTIKQIERNSGAADLARLQQEAKAAGNLRHPNIVTVFDVDLSNAPPYIVMDFIEGHTLQAQLDAAGRFLPGIAILLLGQIADAIDFAHSQGVLHRDIKPGNIIIDQNDRLYVLDFGLALLELNIEPDETSAIVGTPVYMSPEQVLNKPLDKYSDLFSLAVVAYQMFTGRLPFTGKDYQSILNSILRDTPPTIEKRFKLPVEIEIQLQKALNKDPQRRFNSANEMISAFKGCFSEAELKIKDSDPSKAKTFKDVNKNDGAQNKGNRYQTDEIVKTFNLRSRASTFTFGWFEYTALFFVFLGFALIIWSIITPSQKQGLNQYANINNMLRALASEENIDLTKQDQNFSDTELLAAIATADEIKAERIVGLIAEAKKRNLPWLQQSMIPLLDSYQQKEIRVAAIEALAIQKNDQIARLLTGLTSDKETEIAMAAARSIKTVGSLKDVADLKYQIGKIDPERKELIASIKDAIVELQGYPFQDN